MSDPKDHQRRANLAGRLARLKRLAGPSSTAQQIKKLESVRDVSLRLVQALKSRGLSPNAFAALARKSADLVSQLQKAEDRVQHTYKMVDEAESAAEEAEDLASEEIQDYFRRSVRPAWRVVSEYYASPTKDRDMTNVLGPFISSLTRFISESDFWG